MEILVITGMSGAGRTQATKVLEDCGYFCIDNLPLAILPKFVEMFRQNEMKMEKLALVIDIRSGNFAEKLLLFKEQMATEGFIVKILFLDCDDNVLVMRYKENRRFHPLTNDGDNLSGIKMERDMLKDIRKDANYYINTTKYSIWDLKKNLFELFKDNPGARSLKISIVSFGYKFGLPTDCDLVVDVRFLPNPFYVQDLKELTGNNKKIVDYLFGFPETEQFITKYMDLLQMTLPYYSETREMLVIGVGCTGGKHRSVAIANDLSKRLSELGYSTTVTHRELTK